MKNNARAAALYALSLIRRDGTWPDESVRQASRGLAPRDAALCIRLVFTVLQNTALLDDRIAKHCSMPLKRLEPLVLDALRLGVCQLKLLDKIPASAAISETVELVRRRTGDYATGLCNAVLRAIDRDTIPFFPEGDTPEALALRYSHPLWLTERFVRLFGSERTEKLLSLNNTPPPLTVHANPLKTTPEELCAAFARLGGQAEPVPDVPGCLWVSGIGDVTATALWEQGHFLIADPAARKIVDLLAPCPGEHILDCCAAPGGKSFLLAFALMGQGFVSAMDLYPHKVKLLEAGIRRLGLTKKVLPMHGDATSFLTIPGYDAILADVPCSGIGVIRKKPDIRSKTPEGIAALPELQLKILQTAVKSLKPGGRLVYSTCTLLPEENEQVIQSFLRDNPGFSLVSETTLFPPESNTDGFYYAKLES